MTIDKGKTIGMGLGFNWDRAYCYGMDTKKQQSKGVLINQTQIIVTVLTESNNGDYASKLTS